jgi:hypothetical protein
MTRNAMAIMAIAALLSFGPAITFAAAPSTDNGTQACPKGQKKCHKGHHHKKGQKDTKKQGNEVK